jgi:hypothetical protein
MVHLHGIPAVHLETAVELVKAVPALTGAKKMECRTFPLEWLRTTKVMLESGAKITNIELRPITSLQKTVACPSYEWDFSRERSEAELEESLLLLKAFLQRSAARGGNNLLAALLALAKSDVKAITRQVLEILGRDFNFKTEEISEQNRKALHRLCAGNDDRCTVDLLLSKIS